MRPKLTFTLISQENCQLLNEGYEKEKSINFISQEGAQDAS